MCVWNHKDVQILVFFPCTHTQNQTKQDEEDPFVFHPIHCCLLAMERVKKKNVYFFSQSGKKEGKRGNQTQKKRGK
jgi:hypothetical protein